LGELDLKIYDPASSLAKSLWVVPKKQADDNCSENVLVIDDIQINIRYAIVV
jgi:hypothetical protein